MHRVTLPGVDLTVSRFGFGTASLHHIGGLAAQVAHLEAAAAAGFSHFDTAPLYGFGGAERALGAAFAGASGITIATKVGLYPAGGAGQGRTTMLMRKVVGKALPALSRPLADFAVTRARQSLDESLTRLGRDRIDLLLAHEPVPGLLATDEWQLWAEGEAERIGAVGLAGPARSIAPFLKGPSPLTQVLQVQDSAAQREADTITQTGRALQLTYGYFHKADGSTNATEILRGALARNRSGAILISTRNRARLLEIAAVAADSLAPSC